MELAAAEISSILKQQIKDFGQEQKFPRSARCSPSGTGSPVCTV